MSDAREERWVELLLHGGGDELEAARRDPEVAERLAVLEGTLERTRRAAREAEAGWSRRRERALVARVLARTTREDLGWRGELSLFGGFVRERLAASSALRLLAASLVVHLAAAPVLAWWIHRPEEPALRIGFQVAAPEDPVEAVRREEPEVLAPVEDPVGGPDAGEVANALRRARFLLSRASVPGAGEVSPQAALEIRLLAARSRFLVDGRWEAFLDERATLERGGSTATALLTALLLDRYVVDGERAPLLAPALGRLAGKEPSRLVVLALERARAYGLREAPRGFEPTRHADPWTGAWSSALEDELAPGLRTEPLVRSWIELPSADGSAR